MVLLRVFVTGSLFLSLTSLVLWVIHSMPKALNKRYTLDNSVQVLYFLLCKNHPLKICPKEISVFFSWNSPPFSLSSNNIISIVFSVQTENLWVSRTLSSFYPSPILSPKPTVLSLKSVLNLLFLFYSQSLCSSLGLITPHY